MWLWIVQNTVIAAGLALVVTLLCRWQRERPAFCHFLWLLVLATLVMPPLPFSFGPGDQLRSGITAWFGTAGFDAAPPDRASFSDRDPSLTDVAVLFDSSALAAAQGHEIEPARATPLGPTLSAGSDPLEPSVFPWSALALAVWIAGGVFLVSRQLARMLSFHRLVRSARPAPRELVEMMTSVAERMQVQPPRAAVIEGVNSPSVWCLGRPRVLWPAEDAEGRSSTARSIMAHELAHLGRRDHFFSWAEMLAKGLCWWNPLFWIIRDRVHFYAELSCDAWALWAYPNDRRAYAEALIDAQQQVATAPVSLVGLGATNSEFNHFERRLTMIMKDSVSRRISKGAAAAAVFTTVLVLPSFSGERKQKPVASQPLQEESSSVEELAISRKLIGEADALLKQKKFKDAVGAYERSIALDPSNGEVHGKLANALVSMGDYAQARMLYMRQLELGHKSEVAAYNLACVAALLGETDNSMALLRKAVGLGFSNAELMATDSDLDSLREYEEVQGLIVHCQKSAELKAAIDVMEKGSTSDEAYEAYKRLTDIRADDGKLHHQYGLLLLRRQRYDDACQAFQQQIRAGYSAANGYYNLACAYALVGDQEAAIDSLAHATKLGMGHAEISNDPDLKALSGDPRFEALKKKLSSVGSQKARVEAAVREGRFEEAVHGLRQMQGESNASKKQRGWASFALGETLHKMGRYEEALKSYEQAIAAEHQIGTTALRIAVEFAALGDEEAAREHLYHAIGLGLSDAAPVRKLQQEYDLISDEELRALEQAIEARKKEKTKKIAEKKAAEKAAKESTKAAWEKRGWRFQ